jgi:uncharacterized protein (TIGR02001 family)
MCRTVRIAALWLGIGWICPPLALGAEEGQAEASHTLTGNLTLASDYRSRGLSQTFGEGFELAPSIQGGLDYAHIGGFYAGNWNYNISSNQYPNGTGLEMDFYAGYKRPVRAFTFDVGTIVYYYPGSEARGLTTRSAGTTNESFDTWELYAGGSWQNFSLRYYYSLTDYFGLSEDAAVALDNPKDSGGPLSRDRDTYGSQYLTASWTQPLSDVLALNTSLGYLWVANYGDLNYLDYKVGLTYTVNAWSFGASVIGSNADENYYYAVNGGGTVQEIGKPTLMLTIGRGF